MNLSNLIFVSLLTTSIFAFSNGQTEEKSKKSFAEALIIMTLNYASVRQYEARPPYSFLIESENKYVLWDPVKTCYSYRSEGVLNFDTGYLLADIQSKLDIISKPSMIEIMTEDEVNLYNKLVERQSKLVETYESANELFKIINNGDLVITDLNECQ